MISRRTFNQILSITALLAAAAWPVRAMSDGLTHTDDGLIYQPWFLDSFLILNEDLADAQAEGKRFAVFWELKGCPYCEETHRVNLADPEILEFVTSNFTIIQLNIIGARVVTDFDGEELSERDLARKWGVKFTPTIQFFGDSQKRWQESLEEMERSLAFQAISNPSISWPCSVTLKKKLTKSRSFTHTLESNSKGRIFSTISGHHIQ